MVEIGDNANLNEACVLQGHSLEEGVFKSDHIVIGARVDDRNALAFVHYGVTMGENVVLDPDSFLMKGERPDPNTIWQGNPAKAIRRRTVAVVSPRRRAGREASAGRRCLRRCCRPSVRAGRCGLCGRRRLPTRRSRVKRFVTWTSVADRGDDCASGRGVRAVRRRRSAGDAVPARYRNIEELVHARRRLALARLRLDLGGRGRRRSKPSTRAARFCLADSDAVYDVEDLNIRFKANDDKTELAVTLGDAAYHYTFDRIPALPAACLEPPGTDPLSVFDAAVATIDAHYAFLKARKVDWPNLVATARARLTAETTEQGTLRRPL